MSDVSPVVGLAGFAGSIGAGLFIAKQVIDGYRKAKWNAEQKKLGLDKDLPPPPPPPPPPAAPRLPPPAAAAVLPTTTPPSRPPRVDPELSRVALSMIEELQLTMRRQRVQLDKLEADTAMKDAVIDALKAEVEKQQEHLQRQRLSLDRLETENTAQANVINVLHGEAETLRNDIAAGNHERRDDRKPHAGPGEYRDYAGVRSPGHGAPVLRPQGNPLPRRPTRGKDH